MSSCVELPEDIVVKILCRLPVKSLIRFTCVSKRWRSIIISDPKFGKSHLQLASQLGTLRRKVLLTSYPAVIEPGSRANACYDGSRKSPPLFQSLEDKFSVKNLTFPSGEIDGMEEMGSCNGLVLVGQPYRDHYENLSIWNLSTGFFRKIPNPSFRVKSAMVIGRYFINYGFGHVSATASDDYKLVFLIPAPSDMLEVHIFSLSANIWKVIRAPYSSWPGWISGQGTFSNGAIHWVIPRGNETLNPVIYAFIFAEEDFRVVPLPPVLWQIEQGRNQTEITTLVHLGGYLCVWSRGRYFLEEGEVWAMTEYGVPESWVKLFQFNTHDLRHIFSGYCLWDLCFITESDTMVLRLKKELLWIECRNEEKPVCSGRYRLEKVQPKVQNLGRSAFYFRATVYDETLVSVAE